MSKMDNLRAMREARYDRAAARAKPASPAVRVAPPARVAVAPAPDVEVEELCGHRNMGGRTCTREKGHAAKSHRYG